MPAPDAPDGIKDRVAPGKLALRLYIAPGAPNSERALSNVTALCAQYLSHRCTLEIVDVRKEPLRALADEALVTPTLLRLSPEPVVRIVGNLSQLERVLDALGLKPPEQDDDRNPGG